MKLNQTIYRFILFLVFCFLTSMQLIAQSSKGLEVGHLKCEYKENPIGIEAAAPRFSWLLYSPKRGTLQTAYRILVADDSLLLQKNVGNIWDSKKVFTDQSIQVSFAGNKLQSAKTYYWKVMVWANQQQTSAWSQIGSWQMGLLSTADWKGAQWIAYNKMRDSLKIVPAISDHRDPRWNKGNDVLPLLRKEFSVNKKVKRATMFIIGLGQFELNINGKKVGDHFLDPGWTQYSEHALYVSFDITQNLKPGENAIGVMLGNGFYYVPGDRYHKLKGSYGYPKMICRTLIEYMDGSTQNVVSDGSWQTAPGPVTFSSIYGGEDYNANQLPIGWDLPGFTSSRFKKVVIVDGPPLLESQQEEPLKILEHFKPQKITQPKPGIWVYDMGQNASAIPFIRVKGKKGAVVKIKPAELLNDQGLVMQDAVGTPVYFNYTLKGDSVESWHPQFMYYGFRYIQVEGATPSGQENTEGLPVITGLQSWHTRNAAATIGTFNCSNVLFNRIFKLIDWAIRSNTVSIFTDCPHREKLGWLEEAHLVGSSIRYNYDIATLCRKVVKDMIHSQTSEGLIPDIAPEYTVFGGGFRDSPEWGSNGIIMPWYIYQWYGDRQVLEESYGMMTRYAAYLEKKSKNHILYFGLGDWYDIGPKDLGPSQLTPMGITGTAIYYYDLTILEKVAALLDKPQDVKKYQKLRAAVKQVYNDTFYHKQTHQYGTGSQTANAMSVYMGLVPEADKKAVVDNIVKDIRAHNNGVTAGDIGFRYLLRVLDNNDRSDVIYDMNSRTDVPGYGLQLAKGATALTESWQGNTISSNNHFMLGHLMEWFYSGLGGIRPAENTIAFHDIVIRPEPVGNIHQTNVTYNSPYGQIATHWKMEGGNFRLQVTIPVNTTATIYLPVKKGERIFESGKDIGKCKSCKLLGYNVGRQIIKVGSGDYYFQVVPGT